MKKEHKRECGCNRSEGIMYALHMSDMMRIIQMQEELAEMKAKLDQSEARSILKAEAAYEAGYEAGYDRGYERGFNNGASL